MAAFSWSLKSLSKFFLSFLCATCLDIYLSLLEGRLESPHVCVPCKPHKRTHPVEFFYAEGRTLRITVAVSLAANLVLRSVAIVLVTGRHPYDVIGSSAYISVTVVCAMSHGMVEVSLTRWTSTVIEHDQLVVEPLNSEEVFDDAWESDETVPCRVWDVNWGFSGVDSDPNVGSCMLYDLESERALLCCVGLLGVERLPMSGGRVVEPENVSLGVMSLLFPACILESKGSDDKKTVITDVYETTTLTLTVPSDVMTRRSLLLGVLLVDVINEKLRGKVAADKPVARLPDSSTLEREPEIRRVSPLSDLRVDPDSKVGKADEISLNWNGAVIVVGSATVGRDPGFNGDV